jgi:microcystin-dependent protein
MDVFIGQILTFGGTFAPLGFMQCAGQSIPIEQNDVLYQLIGTTYGGDGVKTFNLPNLQGRTPIHMGTGPGLSSYAPGQAAGSENITLNSTQLPSHNHNVSVVTGSPGNVNIPAANTVLSDMFQQASNPAYPYTPFADSNQVALAPPSIGGVGGSQPHENRQPFLAITYCIAMQGIFPSQN